MNNKQNGFGVSLFLASSVFGFCLVVAALIWVSPQYFLSTKTIALSDSTSTPIVHAIFTDGLIAYYPFTGNANDESGNGNNGTVNGAKLSMDQFLQENRAYQFDGVESFIDIGTGPALKKTDGLTISVWVRPETFEPTYQNIISDHSINELNVGPGKILRLYRNEIQFHVGGVFGVGTAIYTYHSFEMSALDSWHHVVGTYDRNTINLFVDGIKVDSKMYTEPLSVNDNPLLIGSSGFGEFFKGSIDEVRIYNRAISENEIQLLYRER